MTVTIERHDIYAPEVRDHGRPRAITIAKPKTGELHVHVERGTGALWLFAIGPSGGDRGRVAFPTRNAGRLREWLEADDPVLSAPSTRGALRMDGSKIRVRAERHHTREWVLSDDDAARALREALLSWADLTGRADG